MDGGYIGSIVLWSGNRIPVDWLACNGQTLSIQSYAALYSLIGNIYGGDGRTNFALPDLRGCLPLGAASTTSIGQKAGTQMATVNSTYGTTAAITAANLPAHNHTVAIPATNASTNPTTLSIAVPVVGTTGNPTSNPGPTTSLAVSQDPATGGSPTVYSTDATTTTLKPFTVPMPTISVPAQTVTSSTWGNGAPTGVKVNVPAVLTLNYIICVYGLYPTLP